MRSSSSFALGFLALGTLLSSRTARADDVEQARKHFTEGVKRYEASDYEGARALFREADAEHHAAVIVYNIARAEERLAHPQAAVDAYEAYIGEAGERGEFTQAAILAIARVKASARQIRIETKPAGARLFIDGAPTRDPAPSQVLVAAGRHHVVAEGDGWRAETDIDTALSKVTTATLTQAGAGAESRSLPAEAVDPSVARARSALPTATPETSDGFVFGAQFSVVPHRFDATSNKPFTSFGVAAGFMAEAGYALSEDLVALGRVLFAIGPKGVPATTIGTVGVALSYRIQSRLWIGATFQGGRAILPGAIIPAPGERRRFDTDYVFCPSLELSVVVLNRAYGQWMVSVSPGYFFADTGDNDVFYVPIGFGIRTF